jgi:hypothetical protein
MSRKRKCELVFGIAALLLILWLATYPPGRGGKKKDKKDLWQQIKDKAKRNPDDEKKYPVDDKESTSK